MFSGHREAGLALIALDQPSWLPIVVLPVTFLLLLFPDGHLPSPRWRWFAWGLGVALTSLFTIWLLRRFHGLPEGAATDESSSRAET